METFVTPLVILTRAPVVGRVKTRLAGVVGVEGAARLQQAFLRDITDSCAIVPQVAIEIHVDGDLADPSLEELRRRYPCLPQVEGNLGDRIERAIGVLVAQHGIGIVIGSDAPTLPTPYIERARIDLAATDVVMGPTADGGFYLLGASRPLDGVLAGVRWSTANAAADVVERVEAQGLRVSTLPPWYDVDTPRELSLLRAHLETSPLSAPYTARVLRSLKTRPNPT